MPSISTIFVVSIVACTMLCLPSCADSDPPLGTDPSVKQELQKLFHDDLQLYLTVISMERVFKDRTAKECRPFFDHYEKLDRPSLDGGDIEVGMKRLEDRVKEKYGDQLAANPQLEIRGYDEFKSDWKKLLTEYRKFPSQVSDIKIQDVRVIRVDRAAGKSENEAMLTLYDLERKVKFTAARQGPGGSLSLRTSSIPLPARLEDVNGKLKIRYPE
jgi:hypothetical protein